jgi:predicted Zn-dependent protease
MAGYDPREATGFWERMAGQEGRAEPPEFLSTHPSSATRIRNIKKLIPEVMPYFEKSRRS